MEDAQEELDNLEKLIKQSKIKLNKLENMKAEINLATKASNLANTAKTHHSMLAEQVKKLLPARAAKLIKNVRKVNTQDIFGTDRKLLKNEVNNLV